MKKIIIIVLTFILLYTSNATAGMKEIEAIRKEIGEKALIIPVSDNNCSHIYIVKRKDGSIWTYSSNAGLRNTMVVRKALIFKPDKDVHH